MDLTGFTAFDFSEGTPYVSFTKNGVTFSKAVTLKLGKPEYVRLLINSSTKQIALQTCAKNDDKAVQFYKPKKSGVLSVRWNARDLLSTFQRLLGTDFESTGCRADGVLVDPAIMLFDLNNPKPLV